MVLLHANHSSPYNSWYAGEAVRNYGDIIPSSIKGVQNMVIKQPIGVCAISECYIFYCVISR